MTRRGLALAGGIAAFAIGLGATVAPASVPIDVDRTLVALLGGLALVQTARVANARRRRGSRSARTGDPERIAPSPPPGDDLEATLAGFGWITPGTGTTYERRFRVREGIRAAATAVLSRAEGIDPEVARDRIDRGTWTDDPYVAGFLGRRRDRAVPLGARLRGLAHGTSAHELSVDRAIDAVVELAAAASPPDAARPPGTADGSGSGEPAVERADDGHGEGAGTDEPTGAGGGSSRGGGSADGAAIRSAGDGVRYREPRPTRHWGGVGALALCAVGVGVLVERPALLLVGVVGIAFAAFARSGTPPSPSLSIERSLDAERPGAGDEVSVSLTVRNDGDRAIPDLRIVDGVPPALPVVDGPPRLGTALRPGEAASLSYAVRARRGVHAFEPVHAVTRDLSGGTEQEWFVDAETSLTCVPRLRPAAGRLPLSGSTVSVGGATPTVGGDGTEFHATRDYRPGDPISRIDWNYRARTGDLATVELRQERAAAVVLLVDARDAARVAPVPTGPHAVDRAATAAGRLFARLADDGARVGLGAVGSTSCFLPPDSGTNHRARARELLATHPALASTARGTEAYLWQWRQWLVRRLPAGTQIVFVSPLLDAYAARLARHLDAAGHPVTVVAPDPTAERTASQRLARVGRRLAVADLRDAGLPVLDWPWDVPFEVALARAPGRGHP